MDSYENPFALVTLGINDVPRIQDDNPDKRVPLQNHLESLSVILEETKRLGEVIYLTQYPVDYISLSIDSDLLSKYRVSAKEKVESAGVKVIDIFGMVTNDMFNNFIDHDELHFNNRGHQYLCNTIIHDLHQQGFL